MKLNADGTLEWYKEQLMAKGYTQQVDFVDTFSHVSKMTIIIILSMAAAKN